MASVRPCGWLLAVALLQGAGAMAADSTAEPVITIRRAEPTLLAQATPQTRRVLATGEPIGVLFPDIGEPFRKVFAEIIGGIEDQSKARVRAYPIGANQDAAELSSQMKRDGTRVVIALGRQGVKAAGTLDMPLGVVVSGVVSMPDPEKQVGISLTPDPALLFAHLKALLPGIRRVIVVYNPHNSEWLIKIAREAARAQGLELVAHEARDLAAAARQYETALAAADGRHDALWLPQDPTTIDEATAIPIVLRESWNRAIPVFSSSLLHVKKGALFALSPDNAGLGRNLASLAIGMLAGEPPRRGVTPVREVFAGLNLRTASHIGINVSAKVQRSYDFLFPEP